MTTAFSRRDLFALIAGGASFLLLNGSGEAQAAGSLCSFSKFGGGGGLAPATPGARRAVNDIVATLDMRRPVEIFRSRAVQNAAAHPRGSVGPVDTIVYNPDFLNQLRNVHPIAPVSVLAHEVGHFTPQGGFAPHPWTRELTADYVSGCAMRRLGSSRQEATIALQTMFDMFGSPGHPDTPRRMQAMMAGFSDW